MTEQRAPGRGAGDVGAAVRTEPASLSASGVEHVFANGFRALEPTDLEIEAGTFCTLLGPSGSGKTTLLRIFAGLIQPTGGTVRIGGTDVTNLPVQSRDIGFVFQHYALFPHMTVSQNIAFPLRIRGLDPAARTARVAEMLELTDLTPFASRKPHELSGGQQQRVAIARALSYGPRVLLLDEPLGALDRKLRQQLGADLRRIQHETGTTAVYVTHDQEEAFLLSDSVVVMNHGQIRQKGVPDAVYDRPRDLFVASFLGDTNVVHGIASDGPGGTTQLEVDDLAVACTAGDDIPPGSAAAFSIRPEDITLLPASDAARDAFSFGEGVVADRIFMGSRHRVTVTQGARTFSVEVAPGGYAPPAGTPVKVTWPNGTPVLISIPEASRRSPVHE